MNVSVQQVESKYKELDALMLALKNFIASYVYSNSELESKFELIKRNQRTKLELMISQANKTMAVDVGNESLTDTDVATAKFTPHELVRRATAKKLARPLLQKYHPDKTETANVDLFNLIRRASNEGDVELLSIYRYKEGVDTTELDETYSRVCSRVEKLKGSPLVVCARMLATNSPNTLSYTNLALDNLLQASNPFKEN